MAFWNRAPQPEDKLKLGFTPRELEAAVVFMRWLVEHYQLLGINFTQAQQINSAIHYKVSQKTKRQFMDALQESGVHAVEQEAPDLVRLRWTQKHTGKSFGFVVHFHTDKPDEVRLRIVDSKQRAKAVAYFLVWAAKQANHKILPPNDFLELDRLCSSSFFTRAMTLRMLELLLASEIKSINAHGRYVEIELQAQHKHMERYSISLLSKRIRQLAD